MKEYIGGSMGARNSISTAKRTGELILAAILGILCSSMAFSVVMMIEHRSTIKGSEYQFWSLMILLAFITSAGLLFAARLAFPSTRIENNRIVGRHGTLAFIALWLFIFVLGMWRGDNRAQFIGIATVIATGIAVGKAYRKRKG